MPQHQHVIVNFNSPLRLPVAYATALPAYSHYGSVDLPGSIYLPGSVDLLGFVDLPGVVFR